MAGPSPNRDWYFVCERCECKFFHKEQRVECPRCRQNLTSREQLEPPWRKRTEWETAEREADTLLRSRGLDPAMELLLGRIARDWFLKREVTDGPSIPTGAA